MRFGASLVVIATLMCAASSSAFAKECMEPYGKLVEVSPSVYEVRVKPECAETVAAEKAAEAAKSKSTEAKGSKTKKEAAQPKSSTRQRFAELAVARREEDPACAGSIGTITSKSSDEIVVGFKTECKHLAASVTARSTASGFFSDFFFEGGFEEQITPRRSHQRKSMKCDETGNCKVARQIRGRPAGTDSTLVVASN